MSNGYAHSNGSFFLSFLKFLLNFLYRCRQKYTTATKRMVIAI